MLDFTSSSEATAIVGSPGVVLIASQFSRADMPCTVTSRTLGSLMPVKVS